MRNKRLTKLIVLIVTALTLVAIIQSGLLATFDIVKQIGAIMALLGLYGTIIIHVEKEQNN